MFKRQLAEAVKIIAELKKSLEVYDCRKSICRFLDDFFADIDVVSESLRNHGDKSECFHMLMWCLHCLRNEPQIYILLQPTPGSAADPPTKPGEFPQVVQISQAFCTWFIGRLVRLLARPECSILHKNCREIIMMLLQVLRAKEMAIFKRIGAEIIHSLADLVKINEKLYEDNYPDFVPLTRFQVPLDMIKQSLVEPGKDIEAEGLSLQNVVINISEPEHCELLQINLTKIVHSMLADFCIVDAQHAQILWGCMCCHLEFGDIPLKVCSLKFLSDLLPISGLPIVVLNYFLACVGGLWEMLLNGCVDVEESEVTEIEEASATLITSVITADTKQLRITGLSSGDAENHLSRLLEMGVKFGLTKLHTDTLRGSLSNWICHLLGKFSHDMKQSQLFKFYNHQLSTALFGVFGSTVNYEFIVNPLHKLIVTELHGNLGKSREATETEAEREKKDKNTKRSGLSQKRKRKLTDDGEGSMEKLSKTYGLAIQKLRMAFINRKNDYMTALKVTQVVVELAARGVVHYTGCNNSQDSARVLQSWLSRALIQQLYDLWAEFLLQDKSHVSVSSLCTGLPIIVRSIGSLLALQDPVFAEIDILGEYAWILSLPWLPNDPSWLDLKPVRAKEIAQLSNKLSEVLNTSLVCDCLKVLSFLPKDVASKWRIHIYTQTFADSDPALRLASLKTVPEFLFNLGPNGNHLIKDLLHPLIDDTDPTIIETLASSLGIVSCVVSRKALLKCGDFSMSSEPLYNKCEIKCSLCDNLQAGKDPPSTQKDRSRSIEPAMFSPFMRLLDTGQVSVKTAFIRSIKQMFGHLSIRAHSQVTTSMLTQCLVLVDDGDYFVRKQFSREIHHLLGEKSEGEGESKEGVDTLIMNRLQQVYFQAHTDNNIRLQETVLQTIGQLGRYAENDLLLVVLVSLLKSLLSVVPLTAAVAAQELHAVASHKNLSCQNLFTKFRQGICKFLVEAMHDACTSSGEISPENILHKVARTLKYQDVKAFIQGSEKYIVPFLVSKATPVASNLLKMISTLSNMNTRRLLLAQNMKYIFSYLVRLCQASELEKALAFLQSEAGMNLGKLIRLDFQRLHNELLLHLSSNYQQVFNGLRTLSTHDENYHGPKDITTAEQMADYLEPRLLGVLASFDSQLINSNTPPEDKQLAMESLIDIIRLMGSKHIGSIRHKVMNTLRLGRQFVEISCRAWNCFVRSLDYPLLGTMLSQIVATLLPLLEELPKQVADIFNYMIVESRGSLHQHFHEIYFLPDIPELADATAVLKKYADGPSRQSDLKTRLAYSIQGITHENRDVRRHALSKLRKLLREEKLMLNEYVMDGEVADPIISQLVSVLMTGCRESDAQVELLYAECLGELGAIDPGRLELMTSNSKEEASKFKASVEDGNFAVGLINEVLKAFLSATEPRIQDCSAFALQDLLQIYEISEGKDTPNKLWNKFPEHMQEILIPLLSSRYKLTSEAQWDKCPKPIYQSNKGGNFKDWVSNWTGYLIHLISRVNQQSKAARVFLACSACIRHNTQVGLYILPHVAVQVLQDGRQEDATEMYNEILEVVNQVKKPDTRHRGPSDFRHKSAQTVFSVLDYLTKWCRFRAQNLSATSSSSKEASYLTDPGYKAVNGFLERVPKDSLAEACVNCKAYTRALMHFEQFVSHSDIQTHLDFLQRLYVAMDEPDGVLGVAAIRQTPPTLIQEILTHESLGQQQDAQACYERAIQTEQDEVSHHQGLMGSLMELGQMNKALLHANGVLAEKPNWSAQLNTYRIEATWKLGSWDKLELYCRGEAQRRNWAVGVGRNLLAAKDKKEEEFSRQLELVRRDQMGPLAAASMETGSYQRGYENIARLHMLNEIEEILQVLLDFPNTDNVSSSDSPTRRTPTQLIDQWQDRLQMCQVSFRVQEPILSLRRTLLTLCQSERDMGLQTMVGRWWLWSAKVARKAGYLQTAYSSLLQASTYKLPEFFIEKAKWLWEKGNNDEAVTCLEKGISEHFSNMSKLKLDDTERGRQKRKTYAEALLLSGRYSEDTSSLESNAIMKQYKEVIDIYSRWEDGHFYLAKYYDKIMTTLIDDREKPERQGEFIIYVVKYFGQSLQFGNQYIYQSMPRLLSLWLDYGTTVVESEKKERGGRNSQKLQAQRTILARINKIIQSLSRQLQPYQFFTAFPQLISRICHAHPEVFQQLQDLIAQVLVSYPQQAMWMLMAVSKSSYQVRARRCQQIFSTAKEINSDLHKFIQDATKLTERLLEVSIKDSRELATFTLSTHFKPLKRLLEDPSFSPILLPLQSAMTAKLPNTLGVAGKYKAFPDKQVYIKGLDETIEVLPSLQKPKKITLIGSDGKFYNMMCKPKDDMRKDCRLMEFNTIVNKFLRKDPESRRRNLHIRTYTVVPLNEECGLVEWVNNTSGLRFILLKLYREKGLYVSGKELKALMPSIHSSLETKMDIFKNKLLPRHPAVFNEWFLRTFPDPTSWYNARLAYARTSAVISMVGYILGLGDRHGENILYDSTTGDCVHVDFNCLFNKGETFEWPERVPFRLTHNMVSALGPMGVEGIFRQACEVTLRVMRNQMDPLMSILKPFIYDPLVEWVKMARGQRSNPTESGEISNEQAMNCVQNIEHRLKGILKNKTKPRGLPLSIEGHVNYLIKEATDDKNLSQMYIGWAAYL